VGQWVPLDQHMDLNNLSFELHKNEQVVQKGHSSDMIFPLEHIIQYVSQYFTLNIGDLIFTGTPAGVGEADVFDEFEGFLQGQSLLQLSIK
jgi:2-keto-4-pentenoate hydratase/2-oxohepta-3-ene-1,7-dioic acid hydratase in catechol pathway